MKRDKIIIGTRNSKLAEIYAERAKKLLSSFFNNKIEISKIQTSGDIKKDSRLDEYGGKGIFIKEIETDLINKKIDLAVHSLKDMPTVENELLITNCFLKRNDPKEILISKNGKRLEELDPKSIIGTSSFRREYQIKQKRKDLNFKIIRGNIETRIKKLRNEDYDAIILAKAGLMCLDSKNFITQEFETSDFIPSAGQGIVVVQCRKDDKDIIDLIENINDENSRICARAERKVLEILSGDCSTPVGVISFLKDDKIKIAAELFSVDGKKRYYVDLTKEKKFYIELGIEIGKILKKESKGSYKI
tara:strand:+ start:3147 stop:4058 length:912 start_codon:yes stop_codon:yes gene_type:complete